VETSTATTTTSTSESLVYPLWEIVTFFSSLGGESTDVAVAAIIGAMFSGVAVFAVFYARKRRSSDDE
jgi:hypothetical protein